MWKRAASIALILSTSGVWSGAITARTRSGDARRKNSIARVRPGHEAHVGSFSLRGTDFYYDVDLVTEVTSPAARVSGGGPSGSDETNLRFNTTCDYMLWSDDGSYWSFTAEGRLKDPSDSQLAYSDIWDYKPSVHGQVAAYVDDPDEGTYTCVAGFWVESYFLGNSNQAVSLSYDCPGDLDKTKIRKEYQDHGMSAGSWPACSDLQSGHSSTYFSSSELNVNGLHSLFLSTATQRSGLDSIRSSYGAAIGMSSGYRCPDKNQAVGGVGNSLHMFGRAGDLVPSGESMTSTWRSTISALAVSAGAEAVDEGDHVHVEW